MKTINIQNDDLFEKYLDLIQELCSKNWIPSEIAKRVGMDRHAMINRLRKFNLKINKRSCVSTDGMKICSCCKEEKSVGEFAKNSNKYSSRCKTCRRVYLNQNKRSSMFSQIKNQAKHRGWTFNLTLEDIVIPEYCPILGVKLDSAVYRYSPSVDRIDPSKGYIKGNVWIISVKANNMKNDATPEELQAFVRYYSMNPVGTQNIINVFK